MADELLCRLALTMVPNIGDVQAGILLKHFGEAAAIFKSKQQDLERIEGIGSIRARAIRNFRDFGRSEKELKFIDRRKIRMICLIEESYPKRLLNCADAPPVIFVKGEVDLNPERIIAVVGTRSLTDYGKGMADKLVNDLAALRVTIVSGLAYGIDAVAHRASINYGLPTIGVVAHGLDTVYPSAHSSMVAEIIRSGGGLLTEFVCETLPDRHHFPLRNRIVAGMTDATVVIETHRKGGSMITAKLANEYHRDVFAMPGRTSDLQSSGCNYLIQHNKAMLINNADDLTQAMGWQPQSQMRRHQRELFVDLTEHEQALTQLLMKKQPMHVDEFTQQIPVSVSTLASMLLSLELKNIIISLPGKMYRLL